MFNSTMKGLAICAMFALGFNASAQEVRFATNTATITHPNDPNTADNSATDSDTIVRVADLTVSKSNPDGPLTVGATTTYTIVARNLGPSGSDGAVVADDWTQQTGVNGLDCSAGPATCAASGSATCPAPASVTPAGLLAGLAIPVFPNGGVVTFTLQCVVTQTPP